MTFTSVLARSKERVQPRIGQHIWIGADTGEGDLADTGLCVHEYATGATRAVGLIVPAAELALAGFAIGQSVACKRCSKKESAKDPGG